MQAVLDDTVAFYEEDPSRRSVMEKGSGFASKCVYIAPNGNRCALGRYIEDEHIDKVSEFERQKSYMCGAGLLFDFFTDEILRPEVRSLPTRFWADLQTYHDSGLDETQKKHIQENIDDGYYQP